MFYPSTKNRNNNLNLIKGKILVKPSTWLSHEISQMFGSKIPFNPYLMQLNHFFWCFIPMISPEKIFAYESRWNQILTHPFPTSRSTYLAILNLGLPAPIYARLHARLPAWLHKAASNELPGAAGRLARWLLQLLLPRHGGNVGKMSVDGIFSLYQFTI